MKQILLLLLIVLPSLGVYAQNSGIISGIVQDNRAVSLPGATLKLDKYNRYTISDQNGYYEFLNVPEGTYTLEVTYIGFAPFSKQVTVSMAKNTVYEVVLEESSIAGKEVVVMGDILRGQAKALNRQKTNSNISNIISSDQVGRFPDSNIGEALRRVPGITMQNDQGEARNIIIRGLAPELNSVTLNSNRIPSAEGDNRNIQMDLIPADMISSIEVSKTLTSDMDADAIGGSVDLLTRATPNKQRISATISGGYNPIREGYTHSGAFIYGNRFFNNKLGIVASASIQNKDYGSDNIEAVWSQDEKNKDNVYVSQFDIRKYDVQRIRRSFSSAIDFKFNENNSISADLIYNWRDDRENRYRVRYKGISPIYDNQDNITGYTTEIRRETKGGIDNSRNKNRRLEDQRIQNYALRGQHILSSKFDMDWNLSYAKASEDRPNERYIDFNQKKVNLTADLSDERHPLLNPENEDMDNMKFRKLTDSHNYTDEKEYTAKINARIPLSVIDDQKGRLRFGLRGRFKEKQRDNIFYSYKALDGIGVLSGVPNVVWNDKDFGPGAQYIPGMFATNTYLGSLDLQNSSLFTQTPEPLEYLSLNYKAKEQIIAGYVRWDQNLSNNLLLILGLRAENTRINYQGNTVVDGDLGQSVKEKNSYLSLLPNVTLKYNVNTNLILRSAYTTALARPNYYNLVPYKNVSTDDLTISVGNSDLKATYSNNFDLMAEYYFSSVGILSGGLFYKNLTNFIYNYRNPEYTKDNFETDFPSTTNPIPDGEKWVFTQYKNGKGVDIFGFEVALQRKLDFLPTAFLKNFGIYMNYTYTWSEAKGITDGEGNQRNNISLPGTAPHMFNGSLSWENSKLSARVSVNYASDYLDVLGSSEFSDSFYDRQLFLDANAAYKFTPKLRMFAEANNLTNQPLRYYQGSKDRMMQLEFYKPFFNLGLKYDF